MKLLNGIGYDYSNEIGIFNVITKNRTKMFKSLSLARQHYDSLKVTKEIWDVENYDLLAYHEPLNTFKYNKLVK
jgi:hypothetical protein